MEGTELEQPKPIKKDEDLDLITTFEDPSLLQQDGEDEEFFSPEELERMKQEYEKTLTEEEEERQFQLWTNNKELQKDKKSVMEAFKRFPNTFGILNNVSEEIRDDEEVIMEAMKISPYYFRHASERLRDDKTFVMKAMDTVKWFSLESVSERLRDDKEVVMVAVRKDINLQYVSERLRNDREVVMEAVVTQGHFELEYASDELKNDKHFIIELIKRDIRMFRDLPIAIYISKELCGDKDVMREAAMVNYYNLAFAPKELRDNKEFMIPIINKHPRAIDFATERLKGERELRSARLLKELLF